MSSLVISSSDIAIIDQHFKDTYQNLQKLHQRTPRSVVFFLGGCVVEQNQKNNATADNAIHDSWKSVPDRIANF